MNVNKIVNFILSEGGEEYQRPRERLSQNIRLHVEDGTIVVLEDGCNIKGVLTYRYLPTDPPKFYLCDMIVRQDVGYRVVSELMCELVKKFPDIEEAVYEYEDKEKDDNSTYTVKLDRFK